MIDWIFPTAFPSWTTNDDGPEDRAWQRAYASGRLTMGPEVAAFEEEIAAYHGRRHAIAVNSGSSANEVALAVFSHIFSIRQQDVSVPRNQNYLTSVPSIAWSTTYAPCWRHRFGIFILRDCDETWNSPLPPRDPGHLNSGWLWPDLIVGCPILGNPLKDYGRITELAIKHPYTGSRGMFILEDNCESLGARTAEGRLTGTFGDISTGSGFHSHQLGAAELGWILTDDDELARLCRLLRNHGNDGWGSEDFDRSYNFVLMGYNVRPMECHASVARVQLSQLDEMVEFRRANLLHFTDQTSKLRVKHQKLTTSKPSPFGLAFEVESNEIRARLVKALRANGIDCRLPTGGSFLKHPYAAPWRDQKTPRADEVHDCGLFLGNAPWDIRPLIDDAVRVMRETL